MRKGAEKLTKFMNAKQQGRLDGFFTAKPKASEEERKGKGKVAARKQLDAKGTKRKVRIYVLVSIFLCSLIYRFTLQGEEKQKASGSKKSKK